MGSLDCGGGRVTEMMITIIFMSKWRSASVMRLLFMQDDVN